jgi:hypothetical protein
MGTKNDAHIDKVKAQVDEWSARLDVLKAKAAKADASARIELHKAADDMSTLQDAAKKHLEELLAASVEASKEAKSGLDDAWSTMSAAVEAAWKKIT